MNHALISIFRHRTLQLAALITMGVLAGQHLITEHVLTARHLGTLDHLLIFAVTTLWLLPASLAATVLGLRIARFLGIGVTRWQHRVESAGLISIVMLELLLIGLVLRPLTHPIFDALLSAHHHTTDPLHGLLLGQMLTFVAALAGLFLLPLQDVRWHEIQLPALSLRARMRVVSLAVIASMLVGLLPFQMENGVFAPATTQAVSDACTDPNAPQRTYNVSAVFVRMTLNHFGDNDPGAAMYVLTENIPALRAEEAARRVTTGLRYDLIQPLVIRANLGECVTINFTNNLNRAASFHVQSLAYTIDNAGGLVGNNPNTFAAPNGGARTYRISMPPANDPRGEGAYYFYSHGAARQLTSHGLFGALVAEPPGSTYLNTVTGEPLTSGWEAIIVDPNGANFREFTLLWHEIGDEKAEIFDVNGQRMPVLDQAVSGAYRPGSRAMNYRSEPFMDRLLLQQANGQQMDKALAYSSYAFGDPATPIPRSYLGEPTKTRLVHAGSEMFHVYHLHGGGTRWRRNPFADDRTEFDQGLKKTFTENAFSIRLDSQSIAPSETFTLEHECAAGGCQQTAGDYLFHCHIGPHYVAGMWSFWRVYDTLQPDLFVIPTRTPAPVAVNSLGLIGQVVEGRTILPAAQVTDPNTQVALEEWVRRQLPVQGVPFDELDAAVWDWTIEYVNGDPNQPLVLGEPETTFTWANYTPNPGTRPDRRPEIMFNPGNGRYAWPILRPHLGRRPPFASNQHGGAPWAGETATAARPDGMCPANAPNVRFYPVTAIQKRIEIKPNSFDDNGMLYVLNEDKAAVVAGTKQAEPLVLRSNVGDCVDVILTSSLEDARAFHNYSKVNLHIHFVQFDPQGSDGVISGMSFEQSVRPFTTELSAPGALAPVGRTLTQNTAAGAVQIAVSNVSRLHVGSAFGIGLDRANIEIRTIVAIDTTNNLITLDQPLAQNHVAGEPVGVEFVRYRWYSDVDSGTVFYHSHITFSDWYHGLIGAHIIEPPGSTYHDPVTGQIIRSGAIADIRTTGVAGRTAAGPWPGPADGALRGFREFVVFFTADSPANGASGGTINLRASPFATRGIDPGRIFSSVTNNDPFTPIFRAYLGDPVMIRGMSVVEKEGALRITGHRFRPERFAPEGVQVDTAGLDVSERYDMILEGGAGGIQQRAGDYLYYTTIMEQFIDGAWGLLRVYDRVRNDLQVLPGRAPLPSGPGGFPQQAVTGGAPQPAADPGAVCPANAPVRRYEAVIFAQPIPYNAGIIDPDGIIYALAEEEAAIRAGTLPVRPLVMRTNVGDCLEIGLTNKLAQSASLHAGELTYDPQGSYGAAIGFNADSTVAPNARRVYRFYADQDVGMTLFYNLANPTTAARGAFGAIVVEPAGSIYRNPLDGTPVRSGVVADIITPQGSFREFIGLLSDEDDVIGQNQMPYPTLVGGFTGLNYVTEDFTSRFNINADPSLIFASAIHGDPANLLQAHLGDAVQLRVGKPWGTQGQVFGIEGHRWPLEPDMANSNLIASKGLRSGEAIDMPLHERAGGQAGAPGDYFFGDMRAPFQEAGVWGLMRVHPDASSGPLPLPAPGVMLTAANTSSAGLVYLNTPVTFVYQMHNPGSVALTNVDVADSGCEAGGGALTQTGAGNGDNVLDPGETWSYNCVINPAASVVNRLTVTARDPANAVVTAAADASVTVINSQIALTRPAPAAQVQAGQPIAFAYQVSIPAGGAGALHNVVLTDNACPTITRTDGDANNNNHLDLGEVWQYACTVTINANVNSVATVTALDAFNQQIAMVSPLSIEALSASIQLNVQPSTTTAAVGDSVVYNYTVTNSGSAPLASVALIDSLFGPAPLNTTFLPAGGVATGSMTLVIDESHLPGPVVGNVSVTAAPTVPQSTLVNAVATTSVTLNALPSLTVSSVAQPASATIGETVFYTFTVTNNGNTSLSNVVANDTRFGALLAAPATLTPGQSIVQTRSLVVNESMLPGPITNQVTAAGTPPANAAPLSASAGSSVALTYNAALQITRAASPNPAAVGQSINYLFTVRNVGNVTLNSLQATDSRWPVINISVNSLAPGVETTIAHVYVVKESDLPGPLSNTLTVTGAPPGGLPAVVAVNSGAVNLTGTAALQVNQTSQVAQANVGQPITFTYTVRNVGTVTLSNVRISRTYPVAETLAPITLAAGQSVTTTLTGVVGESNLPGPLVSTVTVTGTPPMGAPVSAASSASIVLTSNPAIQLIVQANRTSAGVGETIAYSYTVRNVGDVTLNQVSVNDSRLGAVTLDATTLAPNATARGQRSHTVVEGNLPGPLTSNVTATAQRAVGGGAGVSASASSSVALTSAPAVALSLRTNTATASVGEVVFYTYVVTNTGNVTLRNLALTDSRFGSIDLGSANLAPGASITRIATFTVRQSDLPGPVANNATVTARSAYAPFTSVSSSDSASLALTSHPTLQVTRQSSTASATIGQRVYYTFTVTNLGDVTVSNLSANDTLLGSIVLGNNLLQPNQSTTGVKSYVVTQANLPGPLANTFTVTGVAAGDGRAVSASTGGVANLTYNAALQVERSPSPNPAAVGVTATYRITVTNIGNVTLNGLTATDTLLGVVTLDKSALTPGQQAFAQMTRVVHEDDLPGPLAGAVTVTGAPPAGLPAVSASASSALSLRSNPALELVQTVNRSQADIGDTVVFTILIANRGNVTLRDVQLRYSFPESTTLPDFSLAPGAVLTRTVTYVVREDDLPGPITNAVEVRASPRVGDELRASDEDSVALHGNSALQLELFASHTTASIGDTIVYTYQVRNLGKQTLQTLTLTDDRFGAVALNNTTLAPNAVAAATISHVVAESDLPGPLSNRAIVTATPRFGSVAPLTSAAERTVALSSAPALVLTRQSSRASATVGDSIVYTFTLRNAGDVTLTDLTLIDTRLGALPLAQQELSPGASMQIVATTTVEERDLPGPLANTATARAALKYGGGALTATAGGQVTLLGLPAINLTQQASTNIANVGETVRYTFTVQNIGNVTLLNVAIADTLLGAIPIAGAEGLKPGDRVVKQIEYVVRASDMPGPINNQATLVATPFYLAGAPGGNAEQLTRTTGGTVAVSTSSVTLRHVVRRGATSPALTFMMNGQTIVLADGQAQQFAMLTPGMHTLMVETPEQWAVADASCDNGVQLVRDASQSTLQRATFTYTLERGKHVTCTVSSEQTAYSIFMPVVTR